MSDNSNPAFPALIVADDGSVGGLEDIRSWSDDVDQWFWSEPNSYLVDCEGRRFKQVCERASDGRPLDVPLWIFDRELSHQFIRALIEGYSDSVRIKLSQVCSDQSESYIQHMIAVLLHVDSQ